MPSNTEIEAIARRAYETFTEANRSRERTYPHYNEFPKATPWEELVGYRESWKAVILEIMAFWPKIDEDDPAFMRTVSEWGQRLRLMPNGTFHEIMHEMLRTIMAQYGRINTLQAKIASLTPLTTSLSDAQIAERLQALRDARASGGKPFQIFNVDSMDRHAVRPGSYTRFDNPLSAMVWAHVNLNHADQSLDWLQDTGGTWMGFLGDQQVYAIIDISHASASASGDRT